MRALCLLLLGTLLLGWSAESGPSPWLPAIAALTDKRPQVHGAAMEALIRHGTVVLPDVSALARDADWEVRARVATVAAGIGGAEAAAVLTDLATDQDDRVREVVAAALGRTPGPEVFTALHRLLFDNSLRVRAAAAQGLGVLGDSRALEVLASIPEGEPEAMRPHRAAALRRLTNRPDLVPAFATALGSASGPVRRNLLDAAVTLADPRMVPALVQILETGDDVHAALAALALAASGDTRSFAALCALAADSRRIQPGRVAADTLSKLTGVRAAAGATWALWWRENAETAESLYARDAFIAALHDPTYPVTRAELAQFPPENLMPLLDGVLGDGAWWWTRRAGAVLLIDDPARWTPVLLKRIRVSPPGEERLALIILLDQYGDPGARTGLRELWETSAKVRPGLNDPERAALVIALERRGVNVGSAPVAVPNGRK